MQRKEHIAVLLTLAFVVGLLWLYPWVDLNRPSSPSIPPESSFAVTNPANGGPASLRDAIFRALRSNAPSLIVLRTPEVLLETPLPPLISRFGITIRSEDERSVIRAVDWADLPVLDVRNGPAILENLEIRGATSDAIRVTSTDLVRMRMLLISDSNVAVNAVGSYRIDIRESEFSNNRIGISLSGLGAAAVDESSFSNQHEAAIWAVGVADLTVGTPSLAVSTSQFRKGKYAAVLGNVNARFTDNDLSDFSNDGILLLGGTSDIRSNRVSGAMGAAIRASGLSSGTIVDNELHENSSIGILIQSSTRVQLEGNQVYRNTYGIVSVRNTRRGSVNATGNTIAAQMADGLVVVGDSPMFKENYTVANASAGIRIFHLIIAGDYVRSAPLLEGNVSSGNGYDEPVYSEYIVRDITRAN